MFAYDEAVTERYPTIRAGVMRTCCHRPCPTPDRAKAQRTRAAKKRANPVSRLCLARSTACCGRTYPPSAGSAHTALGRQIVTGFHYVDLEVGDEARGVFL